MEYLPNPADSPVAVKTVPEVIAIRHTVCPVCSRYRQVNSATGRCHCANNAHKHISSERCPLAHCKRVEARLVAR